MLIKLALGNVRKSFGDFGIYFLTVALGVAVFYAFGSIASQDAVDALGSSGNMMVELLSTIIDGVSVFVAFVLAFLVIYANRFLIRRRTREFGLYLVLGMRSSQVAAIVAMETLIAGAASLACGLLLGWAFSQGLMHLAGNLVGAALPGFVMGLSMPALARTVAAFGIVFLLAALANTRTVTRAKPIELMRAGRRNEPVALRNIPLSVVLFALSCGIIALSYHLLLENGLLEVTDGFYQATALVCVGTALLFYSLSGFLLAVGRTAKPLYLRGLNAFTLRQLGSKVNSTSVSAAIICLTLFLAMTSACGGFGIVDALRTSLERTTPYDATAHTVWTGYLMEAGGEDASDLYPDDRGFAEARGYDMAAGLEDSAALLGYDAASLIGAHAQVDIWLDTQNPITLADLDRMNGEPLSSYVSGGLYGAYVDQPLPLVPLSQANAALALAGKKPLDPGMNACVVVADHEYVADYYRDLADKHPQLEVGGRQLRLASFEEVSLETTPMPMNTGMLVVPDAAIPEGAVRSQTILDLQAAEGAEEELATMLVAVMDADEGQAEVWPLVSFTRQETREQSLGLSAAIAFLAVYIGFVLTVACAAVLAIQQLTEVIDGSRRYRVLRLLGTSEGMIARSQFAQVAACFLLPLALALAHTACAMQVVTAVVSAFGHMEIGAVALATACAFLAVYGAYLLATFLATRRLAR